MIRRSANAIAWNNRLRQRLWEVVASRFSRKSSSSSNRDGDHQQQPQRISSDPHRASGNVKSTARDVDITSSRLDDVPHFPTREGHITEHFGVTGGRGHIGWIGTFRSSPLVGYYGMECWSSGSSLSSRPGRRPPERESLLEPWKRSGILRKLSTNSKVHDDSSNTRSEEKEAPTAEAPAQAKTIDDFQHEEIVGPTVERDLSDTANQLRGSLGELTMFMDSLKIGFLLLGTVQLLAAMWTISFHGVGLIHGFSQNLAFVVSFVLAYLLRYFTSAVQFFSRTEERGRMRILTLSLQVTKMLVLFFYRSSFVVKVAAFGSMLALFGNVWHSY